MAYHKDITIEFVVDGKVIGSGNVFVENGEILTSSVEEEFYATLRKNTPSWIKEAAEEEKEYLIDHLTPAQEEKLKAEHGKEYHGTDDDMPDAYEAWLMDLSLDELKKII